MYQIKDAGYDPSIKYEGGKLTHIGLTLEKKVHVLIRTQQLAPSNNDGECDVSSAEIYNDMSAAMNKFNHAVFKPEHKHITQNKILISLMHVELLFRLGCLRRSSMI